MLNVGLGWSEGMLRVGVRLMTVIRVINVSVCPKRTTADSK